MRSPTGRGHGKISDLSDGEKDRQFLGRPGHPADFFNGIDPTRTSNPGVQWLAHPAAGVYPNLEEF